MGHATAARRPEAILIAGPTASGKSALAMRLATRLGGRIINADSMQVYRDLRILTARPSAADMAQVPHRLYGTVDGAETFSVSRWLAAVEEELARARDEGDVPIIVGGTGLYLKALTQGLSEIPAVPAHVRAELRAWAEGKPPETLHAELSRRDPAAAERLRPTDPQRILRALEVHAATGESLLTFQMQRSTPLLDVGKIMAVTLTIDRRTLRSRIAQRSLTMFAEDARTEVATLSARNLDPALPIMRAIGVSPIMRCFAGDISMDTAMEKTIRTTSQYVKRQETFFRHQLAGFRPVASEAAEALLIETAYS